MAVHWSLVLKVLLKVVHMDCRHLSSGRAADAHHLYPPPDALPAGALQAPVDPAREYTCVGVDIDLRVHAGSAASVAPHVASAGLGDGFGVPELGSGPGPEVDPWSAAAAAAADAGGDGGRLVACLGDRQVAFMKALIALAQAPPVYLRMPGKRGTFFARLDPRRPATLSLPKLLRQCALSCILCFQLYACTCVWTLFQSMPWRLWEVLGS